jgi:hypothetical protein
VVVVASGATPVPKGLLGVGHGAVVVVGHRTVVVVAAVQEALGTRARVRQAPVVVEASGATLAPRVLTVAELEVAAVE